MYNIKKGENEMTSLINKIGDWLSGLWSTYENQEAERYLSAAQNLADLESRMRSWEQKHANNDTFYLS
jgi:hypothetical protein